MSSKYMKLPKIDIMCQCADNCRSPTSPPLSIPDTRKGKSEHKSSTLMRGKVQRRIGSNMCKGASGRPIASCSANASMLLKTSHNPHSACCNKPAELRPAHKTTSQSNHWLGKTLKHPRTHSISRVRPTHTHTQRREKDRAASKLRKHKKESHGWIRTTQ